MEYMRRLMREGYEIRGVFLDESKIFDKAWHEGVIFKLKQNGKVWQSVTSHKIFPK